MADIAVDAQGDQLGRCLEIFPPVFQLTATGWSRQPRGIMEAASRNHEMNWYQANSRTNQVRTLSRTGQDDLRVEEPVGAGDPGWRRDGRKSRG